MRIDIKTPTPYDFEASVRGHGWYQLAPFRWLPERQALERVERLSSGRVLLLYLTGERDAVAVSIEAEGNLTRQELAELRQNLRWMLKFDEDLTPFYAVARSQPHLWAHLSSGGGRLLRSSTIFEDVVKTICTTNTTWAMTINMVRRLVATLGDPFPPDPSLKAFPTAEQMARAPETLFLETIRLGYRNEYIRQLASEVAGGERALEALKNGRLDGQELRRAFKSIKGVGDYAANTLLAIMGSYGDLPVDSGFRTLVSQKYFGGAPTSLKEMTKIYEAYGSWKFLAYWFDSL